MKQVTQFFIRVNNPIVTYAFFLYEKVLRKPAYRFVDRSDGGEYDLYDDFGLHTDYLAFSHENRLSTTQLVREETLGTVRLYRRVAAIFGRSGRIKDLFYLYLADINYALTKEIPFFKSKGKGGDPIVPDGALMQKLLAYNGLRGEARESRLLSFLIWLLAFGSIVVLFFRSLVIFPMICGRNRGKVAKELVWGFGRDSILNDDMVYDNKDLGADDVVYFNYKRQPRYPRAEIEQMVREQGIRFVVVDFFRTRPDRYYLINLAYQSRILLLALRQLFNPGEYFLAPVLAKVALHTLQSYRWLSAIDVDYYFSTQNHELLQTELLNCSGVKTALLERSDYLAHNDWHHLFPSHNILFAWTGWEADCWHHLKPHDEVCEIGCLFKYEMHDPERLALHRELDIADGQKVIVFFDSGTGDSMHFNSVVFDDYVDLLARYAGAFPDAVCLVKPKRLFQWEEGSVARKLGGFSNIRILDPDRHGVEKIGTLADLVVGMGINSAATIAMVNRRPTLYYDRTDNRFHPFAHGSSRVVYREADEVIEASKTYLDDPSTYVFPEEVAYFDVTGYRPKARIIGRLLQEAGA